MGLGKAPGLIGWKPFPDLLLRGVATNTAHQLWKIRELFQIRGTVHPMTVNQVYAALVLFLAYRTLSQLVGSVFGFYQVDRQTLPVKCNTAESRLAASTTSREQSRRPHPGTDGQKAPPLALTKGVDSPRPAPVSPVFQAG